MGGHLAVINTPMANEFLLELCSSNSLGLDVVKNNLQPLAVPPIDVEHRHVGRDIPHITP
jgi:hypothetical protein